MTSKTVGLYGTLQIRKNRAGTRGPHYVVYDEDHRPNRILYRGETAQECEAWIAGYDHWKRQAGWTDGSA